MIDRIRKNIVSIVIILIVVVAVVKILVDDHRLSRNHRFTIGVISDIRANRQGQALEFIYNVDKKKYEGSVPGDKFDKALVGVRFYVKFNPSNPNNAFIFLTKKVPDSINIAPKDGWFKIPAYESYYPSK